MAELAELKLWKCGSPKAETSRARWLAELVAGRQAERRSSVLRLRVGSPGWWPCFSHVKKSQSLPGIWGSAQTKSSSPVPRFSDFSQQNSHGNSRGFLIFPRFSRASIPGWKPCCSLAGSHPAAPCPSPCAARATPLTDSPSKSSFLSLALLAGGCLCLMNVKFWRRQRKLQFLHNAGSTRGILQVILKAWREIIAAVYGSVN